MTGWKVLQKRRTDLIIIPNTRCTHIIPQKVVIECAAWFQPEALLGILVVLEESVLVRVAQSLNLGQPVTDLRASVEHGRLKEFATSLGLRYLYAFGIVRNNAKEPRSLISQSSCGRWWFLNNLPGGWTVSFSWRARPPDPAHSSPRWIFVASDRPSCSPLITCLQRNSDKMR